MGPELRVSTFRREGGRAVQQQDFSVPASAPPLPPPPKRDPYQGFADDDTTKKATNVPLKFLQRAHGGESSSNSSNVHPNDSVLRGINSAPSKARPGHSLADAVLKQQAGLGDQDGAALVQGSAQQGMPRMVLPEAVEVAAPESGGAGGVPNSSNSSQEHGTSEQAGCMDTQVASRDQTEVAPRQHTLGLAMDSCVSDRGAGQQQEHMTASQRVPLTSAGMSAFAVPASSAQGQSRREIFHRQAKLSAQMLRMGIPPMLEWGSSRVKVGKAVTPGCNEGSGSQVHVQPHKTSSQQLQKQQQRQGHKVQRAQPMSGKLQQKKEEKEQQQEDERRAQHQQAQHAQQAQGVADAGKRDSPQAPVHAWRLEWEARKQRAALNGPAAQRARKLKAQLAKERVQCEEFSSLAAEYEAVYQGMGRVADEPLAAVDGFSHTLLQSMHPHTPGLTRHKTTVPNNEVEGGSRACLKPVGIDMYAWQQAHERLDAYKREQALKQKQAADQKKLTTQDARLERLAVLLAAAQKQGGTLGIDVSRQEPSSEPSQGASVAIGSHQELRSIVSVGVREPRNKADSLQPELDTHRGHASKTQLHHGSSGHSSSSHSLLRSQHQQRPDSAHEGGGKTLIRASWQSLASRPSSSSSTATTQRPKLGAVKQQPLTTHSTINNTTNAADNNADQPGFSQPPRPPSSLATQQHRLHAPAQHHAQSQQQGTQQAHAHSAQPALPQHGPATSHRHEALPLDANKKGQKKGLSVVYYPVKKKHGKGQLQPGKHNQDQNQGQQQGAFNQQHKQGNGQQQPQQQQHQHQHLQHLHGEQSGQDLHHGEHQSRVQKESKQQELLPQPHQQEPHQLLSPTATASPTHAGPSSPPAEPPIPADLSTLPGLCASPGDSSFSSPTAAQLSRFADASDHTVTDSDSANEWGLSSEDADERGFPKAALQGGSSIVDHHPCPPCLCAAQGLEAHDSWEAESSTGSWDVEDPPSPNLARQEPPRPGPKVAPSMQDLLDQGGLIDPTYEPPQDKDIPQLHFSPAPSWLV